MLSKLKSFDEGFASRWDEMVNVTEDEDSEIKQVCRIVSFILVI